MCPDAISLMLPSNLPLPTDFTLASAQLIVSFLQMRCHRIRSIVRFFVSVYLRTDINNNRILGVEHPRQWTTLCLSHTSNRMLVRMPTYCRWNKAIIAASDVRT